MKAVRMIIVRITALILVVSFAFSLCSCAKDNRDFDGTRFSKTRKITVLVDSSTDNSSDLTVGTSAVASYIHDRVLSECNIDVTFVESYKLDFHNGIAADISFTDNYNELATYYRMGAVINLSPYLNEYADSLTDLTDLLGNENLYYCNDDPGEIWCLNSKDDHPEARVTFIRKDWLEKLGLDAPSDIDGLHECLVAFRDNAELLLGDDASRMIPFLIDSEPGISAKPLFDSCLDTSVSGREFFAHGYCRDMQDGYSDGLRTLNGWYLEGLLPGDFMNISPLTRESYEPVQYGYVGAFCSQYDYLYANGENSHISALHKNCGDEADYIAVNTFKDRYGAYTAWQEDYLHEEDTRIFMPSTCSDPLACLVYLNWISNSDNISEIRALNSGDPYTYDRYLITCRDMFRRDDLSNDPACESARKTALDVEFIHHGNMCVSYDPEVFNFIRSETDYYAEYNGSANDYVNSVISAGEGSFDAVLDEQYNICKERGSWILYLARDEEWVKVMEQGNRYPRVRN